MSDSAPPAPQPADPWPRRVVLLCLFQLVAWTAIPLLLHPNVSLDVAEIVSWGHEWEMGYYKHPPLIAWICEAARVVEMAVGGAGGKPWGIYVCGQIAIVATYWAVWRFTRRLLGPREGFLAALALAGTWVCTSLSLEFNHNTLLLPFFAMTGWFGFEALRVARAGWGWWLLLGAAIGLGMMVKYEMFFLAVCVAAFIFIDARSRRWLARPQPYVALVLSLLIFAPNFKWLVEHHFVSLTYAQSRMGGAPGVLGHVTNPLIFLRDQIPYVAAVFILMVPWLGIPRLRSAVTAEERWNRRFVMLLGLGPLGLFLVMSLVTGNSLRGAWGVALVPFVPVFLLVLFVPLPAPIALRQTVSLGLILVGIEVAIAVLQPLLARKPLRVQFPGRQLAAEVDARWHAQFPGKPLPVVAGERWLADNVAFYSVDRPSVLCDQGNYLDTARLDEANCPWTSIAALNRNGGVLVWNATREGSEIPPALRGAFPTAQTLDVLEMRWQPSADVPALKVGYAIVPPNIQQ